jgi:hypothetical protein
MDKKLLLFFYSINGFIYFYARLPGCRNFIESKYNTDTAKILIYNAWWFEPFMFFLIIFVEIKRYQLLKERMGYFIFIFYFHYFEAFVTRYIGYEGMMPMKKAAENFFR